MDYTTVPRSLIYRDRRSLEEFGVYGDHAMNKEIAKVLRTFPIINGRYAETKALTCMNNAYYICTMALLERDPVWRISDYEMISNDNNHLTLEMGYVTITLVYLYLCCLPDGKGTHLIDFLDELRKVVRTYGYFEHIVENIAEDAELPANEFAPRFIDKETVHDALAVDGFNWVRFTNYLKERNVRDIVKAFGSTEEEKHNVVDMLRQASHGFYLASYNDYPEKVDKMLDTIDKEIFLEFNPNEEREITEEDKAELIIPIDPEPYEARIKELEMEVESLTSENKELKKQQPTERPAEDDIESLKQQISELKMEIADMEKREGLDAPKAALLVRIACTKLGGMPNNRENAWPLISNLWGTAEASARKRLRERVKDETVEDLASLFESVSPKIAGIIREEGKVIIEKQKKVKKQ